MTLHHDDKGGNNDGGSLGTWRLICGLSGRSWGWWWSCAQPLRDASQLWQTPMVVYSPPHSCRSHSWDAPAVLIKCYVWWLIKEKTVVLFLSNLRTPHYFYCSNNIAENFIVFEFGIFSEPGRISRLGLRDQSLCSKDSSSLRQDLPASGPTSTWASKTPSHQDQPSHYLLEVLLIQRNLPHFGAPIHTIWQFVPRFIPSAFLWNSLLTILAYPDIALTMNWAPNLY